MCYKPDITGSEEIAITDGGTIKKTTLADALKAAKANPLVVQPREVITVNIPTDFPDLPAAFDELSRRAVSEATQIDINIESGHELTKGLKLKGGDWSRFRIISEDAVVLCASGFVGVSNSGEGELNAAYYSDQNLFFFVDCATPRLACVIDMNSPFGSGRWGMGYQLQGSRAYVEEGCGVINAGMAAVYSQTSIMHALNTVWTGAGWEALRITQASIASFQGAVCDGAQNDPGGSGTDSAAIFCSRGSNLQFQNGSAQNSGNDGADCHRAWLVITNANLSGAARVGVVCQSGGRISGNACNASGAGENAVDIFAGSLVNLNGANLSGSAGIAVRCRSGGNVLNIYGATTRTGSVGVPHIDDIEGFEAFNTPISAGIVFANAVSPFDHMGAFSATGTTYGKRFGPSSILDSSRESASSVTQQRFYNPNGLVGDIKTSGTSTSYNTTSDETLKTFLGALSFADAKAIIEADPVRRFEWISTGEPAVGWGAQTSHAISPDLASPGGWFDADEQPVPEGTPGAVYRPWGIDQSKRTPYLWAAVAGLMEKVAELEEKTKNL